MRIEFLLFKLLNALRVVQTYLGTMMQSLDYNGTLVNEYLGLQVFWKMSKDFCSLPRILKHSG